ncbi:MAG: GNAT family N-acetyltransferase [Thermoplasmata archaeon]|jgi:ribosomal protein S18 acetylase RimI-like enzyme
MRVRRLGPGTELDVLRGAHLLQETPELSAARAFLADERNVLLAAYEGSETVGLLRGTELTQLRSKRKQMFIHEIAVDERFRRRGVGKALVTSLLRECRELGFEEVLVSVDPTNSPAVRLYLTTGALPEEVAERLFVYRLHSDIESPV